MRLSRPLMQLPINFCAETLAAEVRALPASAWVPHPQSYPGNDAVPLVTPGGELNDRFDGSMAATEHLARCPYILGIMAELDGVWGRSRLMGLGAGAQVPRHVDSHYYWRTHLRIHIPVITNPGVEFTCGDITAHMAPGECWTFDSFQPHDVQNRGTDKRVHLVLDTVGGDRLWDLVEAAGDDVRPPAEPWLPAANSSPRELIFERLNLPKVMSPWEIRCHVDYVVDHLIPGQPVAPALRRIERFINAWEAAWTQFGTADEGLPVYRDLLTRIRQDLEAVGAEKIMLRNEQNLANMLGSLVFWNALARTPDVQSGDEEGVPVRSLAGAAGAVADESFTGRFDRPIFVVSTPRSGSTLLFETLIQAPGIHSIGSESHALIEGVPAFAVPDRGWTSNRLTAEDAAPDAVEQMAKAFYTSLHDRDGRRPAGAARVIEKTPKNALRVPFFDAVWPDAEFVFLYRDPRQTMSSMIEAWLSGGFRTYPDLPDWRGQPWSLLLVPGWRKLNGLPLPQIVAHQWATTIDQLVDDLSALPPERVRAVVYDELLAAPQETVERLAASVGLGWDRQLGADLPLSRTTVSRPRKDKWRQIERVIGDIWPIVEAADAKARAFVERTRI